jgi:hypothetical protein
MFKRLGNAVNRVFEQAREYRLDWRCQARQPILADLTPTDAPLADSVRRFGAQTLLRDQVPSAQAADGDTRDGVLFVA